MTAASASHAGAVGLRAAHNSLGANHGAHRAAGTGTGEETSAPLDAGVARVRLGAALRAAREPTGLTLQQVAEALEWSLSKLARIEAGTVGVAATDLRALLGLYEVADSGAVRGLTDMARASRARPWWHDLRDVVRPQVAHLLGYESTASVFLEFAQVLIPGPFQTEHYAAAVIRAACRGAADEERVRRGVDLRQRRAALRLERAGVRQTMLLDETALLRQIGGPAVMRGQMLRLLALMERDDVQIEVLPLEVGAHDCLEGSFTILRFAEGHGDVLYLSGPEHGTLVRDDRLQVTEFTQRFGRMRAQAWAGGKARERIAAAAELTAWPGRVNRVHGP